MRFVVWRPFRAAGTNAITQISLAAAVILVSVGFGLLASYPHYFWAALGIAAVVGVGFLGEAALLGIIVISSGISLAFLTGGQRTLFSAVGGTSIDSLRLALIIGSFVVLAARRPSILAPIRSVGIYVAFLIYAGVTVLWSPSLLDGVRMCGKLLYPVIVFLLSVSVSNRYGDQVLARLAIIAILAAAILNVTVGTSGASLFSADFATRFHGASHPNSIGLFSVFAGLTIYTLWIREGGKRYVPLMVILLAQLIASGSRTALVAGGVGLLLFEWLSERRARAAFATALCVGVWLLVPTFGERTLQGGVDAGIAPAQLGAFANVSGRTLLWADAWSALMGDHQLFGRGLGATDHFFSSRYSDIASIHNGYLLVLIDSGLLGLALVVAFFIIVLVRLSLHKKVVRAGERNFSLLALALTAMFLLASMTESTFGGFDFPTVIMWAVYGLVWRQDNQKQGQLRGIYPGRVTAWSFANS